MIFLEFQLQLIQRIWWWPLRSLPLRSKNRYKFLRIFPSGSLLVHILAYLCLKTLGVKKAKTWKQCGSCPRTFVKVKGNSSFGIWMGRAVLWNQGIDSATLFSYWCWLLSLQLVQLTLPKNAPLTLTARCCLHSGSLNPLAPEKGIYFWNLSTLSKIEKTLSKALLTQALKVQATDPFLLRTSVKLAQLSICHICHIALRELHSYTL